MNVDGEAGSAYQRRWQDCDEVTPSPESDLGPACLVEKGLSIASYEGFAASTRELLPKWIWTMRARPSV